MEKVPQILWGVARGNVHPKNYPHLEFEVPTKDGALASDTDNQKHAYCLLKEGTFIGWCLLNNSNKYCNHIYMWFKGIRKRDWVESYEDLIQAMNGDPSGYFNPQHYKNIEILYKKYSQTDSELLGKEIKLNKTTSNN